MKFLVVGAGLSGSILARKLAEAGDHSVTIIDARNHIGGNCYTYVDDDTGVIVHKYGAHIFNSPSQLAISFFNQYLDLRPRVHRVKAVLPGKGVYSLPVNLHTINQFFGKTLNPSEAREFLKTIAVNIPSPANFEEQALSMIGKDLYESFFKGYTFKQWGVHPVELSASILKRLPIRFNYEDNYYHSGYCAMPANGYTELFEKLLDHPSISIELNQGYSHLLSNDYTHTFMTGPIDQFFDYQYGRLGYRTVYWENEQYSGDFQGNAVNNFPQLDQKYTRIIEHKHFAPWQKHEKSFVSIEYSKETGPKDEPYYPKRLQTDMERLRLYVDLALEQENVSFLGRLATYRYLDMWKVTEETLDFADRAINALRNHEMIPTFSTNPMQELKQ